MLNIQDTKEKLRTDKEKLLTKKKNKFKSSIIEQNVPIKNKNSYVGRTYKVKDNDLPHKDKGSNKIVDIAVIEENGKRIGGVRTTTRDTKNTKSFKPKHKIYKSYKTFLETKFHNGDDLNVEDKRLKENPWDYNLSYENLNNVRNTLYSHSRQSIENVKQRDRLKLNKKSRH